MSLAFVIPTRNRSELAIAAARALLEQDCTVVVSDNSSREDDVRQLREFCGAIGEARILYLRPPGELMMAAHWDWALEQAMARTAATHFGIHYDRKIAKRGSVEQLAAACARHEGTLVTYACDFTYATGGGFGAWQWPGTGRDFSIATSRVVELSARGRIDDLSQAWPLLSNCMVPRALLERVRARFGDVCVSVTPDAAFAYRFCAVAGGYLHFDSAPAVMYAFRHSNGQQYYRGDTSSTFGDFLKLWGDRAWLDEAPIPGLNLGLNVIFHEYNLVRRATGFPPIEQEGYLRQLAGGLQYIQDADEHAKMRAVLEQHGWREEAPPAPPPLWRRIVRRVRRRLRPTRVPPFTPDPVFPTEAEAVEHLRTHERPRAAHNALLDILGAVPR